MQCMFVKVISAFPIEPFLGCMDSGWCAYACGVLLCHSLGWSQEENKPSHKDSPRLRCLMVLPSICCMYCWFCLWVWQTLGLSPRSCLRVYEDSNLSSAPAVPFIGLWLHKFPWLLLSDNWWTFLISNHEDSTPFFSFATTQYAIFFCPWENEA